MSVDVFVPQGRFDWGTFEQWWTHRPATDYLAYIATLRKYPWIERTLRYDVGGCE